MPKIINRNNKKKSCKKKNSHYSDRMPPVKKLMNESGSRNLSVDDDDDVFSFQRPAFPVDLDSDDVDLTEPPTSGIEYLRRVHYEAKLCPPVVVANMDTSVFQKKQTVKINNSNGCIPPPSGFKPTMKWQEEQVQYFYRIRKKLAAYKADIVRRNETIKPPVKLPSSKDSVGWCKLCFGVNDACAISSVTEAEGSAGSKEDVGVPPLLSIICSMSQSAIEKVLNYHINWMEVMGLTKQQGRWFYALLASLEMPLTPETCSSLRTLARNCSALRASLSSPDDPRLVALNLLICLVARCFRQGDLADDP